MEKTTQFFIDYWPALAPILWELVVRLNPSEKSLSILTFVWRILNIVFPDKKTGGGTHIVIWLLMLLPFLGMSQNNMQGRAAYFWDSYSPSSPDSAAIKATLTSYQNLYGDAGGIYYNKFSHKWRIWSHVCPDTSQHNGCWVDLPISGGSTVTANNGLTKTGSNIQLGGPLLHSTTVSGDFPLTFGTSFPFLLDNTNAVINWTDTPGSNLATGLSNTLNLMMGELDSLSGNIYANFILGSASKVSGNGVYNNILSGNQNEILGPTSVTQGNIVSGLNNRVTDSYGNILEGYFTRSIKCNYCFGMGGSNSIATPGTGQPLRLGDGANAIISAFNLSFNSTAQTAGHGVLASRSAIIGGKDHNIPNSSPGTVILGGNAIKVAANDSNYVYLPKIRMGQGNNATIPTDNTITSVLGLNASGYAVQRTVASLPGGTPAGSNRAVQFNKSGVFGASVNFNYLGPSHSLQLSDSSGLTNGIMTLKTISSTSSGDPDYFITKVPPTTQRSAGDNIAIGATALNAVTTGGGNTVVGMSGSGSSITTGFNNVLIGNAVGVTLTTGQHNIAIGDNLSFSSSPFSNTGSSQIQISDLIKRDNNGEVYFTVSRTSCSGAPSGALAVVSGTLTQCP